MSDQSYYYRQGRPTCRLFLSRASQRLKKVQFVHMWSYRRLVALPGPVVLDVILQSWLPLVWHVEDHSEESRFVVTCG